MTTSTTTTETKLPPVPITIELGYVPSGVRKKRNPYFKPSNPTGKVEELRDAKGIVLTLDDPIAKIEDFNKLEVWEQAQIRAGIRAHMLVLLDGNLPNLDTKVTEDTPADDERRKLVPDTKANIEKILDSYNVKKLQLLFKQMMKENQIDRLVLFLELEQKGKARRTVLSFLRKAVKILGENTPTDTPDPTPEETGQTDGTS